MTNEFNFDVKHEDYKEWLNQIEQVSDADCSLLSEPDPYTKEKLRGGEKDMPKAASR